MKQDHKDALTVAGTLIAFLLIVWLALTLVGGCAAIQERVVQTARDAATAGVSAGMDTLADKIAEKLPAPTDTSGPGDWGESLVVVVALVAYRQGWYWWRKRNSNPMLG